MPGAFASEQDAASDYKVYTQTRLLKPVYAKHSLQRKQMRVLSARAASAIYLKSIVTELAGELAGW